MKKTLLLLFTGVLIANVCFGGSEFGFLKQKNDTLSNSTKYSAGKQLTKGVWSLGGTLSAKSNSLSNIDLLLADVETFEQRAFNLRLEGSYFIKENMSVGLGLQFGEAKNNLVVDLLNNSFQREIRNFKRNYGVVGFIKNHIPASSNNVFFITNQTELFYGYENGPSETYVSNSLERKYSVKHSMGLNIRPGILIFFTDNFAFDINMGVLGLSFSKEDVNYTYPPNNIPSENDRKKNSRNKSTDLNLKFDLLRVGFGFSYYF
ncbi:MAG: hypothetical protein PHE03_04405 [Bacteroidales bacterium]|nr:hypothetical protein [Bacteroidales bacterium]MDD3891525.1 hypothetical protein [Bacteroidales bacterium]